MPKSASKKISPALTKAAKDLRKGSGNAGLALAERKQLLKKCSKKRSK